MADLTFGSLFAGIGGADLGFEQAGMRGLWQVEIDPQCRDILARHFPISGRYADVRDVNGADLAPVDVIVFGSPCQDLSAAGQRRGMAGERSGLYFEAIRIIQEMRDATSGRRPTLAVWENVEGALSSHAGRDFGAALDALADCGALDIGWSVLDSQYFDVAQRRRRVFVVADFGGERTGEILAFTESLCGNPAPGRTAWQDIAGPLGQVASSGGGHRLDIDSAGAYIPVSRTLTSPTGERRDGESDTFILQSVNTPLVAFQPTQDVTGHDDQAPAITNSHGGSPAFAFLENRRGEVALSDYTYSLTTGGGTPGQGYPAVAFTERTRDEGRTFEAQEELAYALTNPGSGGRAHSRSIQTGMSVRRLTPTECERLQAFPDGWTSLGASGKAMSDSARYRMLGNAITVSVAKWIGQQIVKSLSMQQEAVA